MSIEEQVRAALYGAAGVTALIGSRIYPDVRSQDSVLPSAVYIRSGTQVIQSIHGPVLATIPQVDVTAISSTRTECEVVANALLAALVTAGFNYLDRVSEYIPDADAYVTTLFVSKPE